MRRGAHVERHFGGSEIVRDVVIGMSDGLTVPFALAAGLSSAAAPTAIIVTAGLAEIAAGSISMGLGGYLAGRTDAEHYAAERAREELEVVERPGDERDEVRSILMTYGLTSEESEPIVDALAKRRESWIDFMMRFELGMETPDPKRALRSGLTIAGAYIVGGLVPLLPYMVLRKEGTALPASAAVTLAALAIFGYVKGHFTGASPVIGAVRTALIGGIAAAAAFLLARIV